MDEEDLALEGTANIFGLNIFGFSGCVDDTWAPPFTGPKLGEVSKTQIVGFFSGPPTGVAGDPEEAGEVAFEYVGDGVSGALSQGVFVGVPGVGELWPGKPGTGLVELDFSSKGVFDFDCSALAARFETKVVG